MDVPYMDGSSSELLSILAKKELFWKFSGSQGPLPFLVQRI